MMTESPESAPMDWDAEDEKRFEALRARSDYAELPGFDLAMWPGDFRSKLDVSDYNDRYLVAPFPGFIRFGLYLASGWHTMAFLTAIAWPLYLGDFDFYALIPYVFVSGPAILMLFLTWLGAKNPPIVFNREAQIIHMPFSGRVFNLPWRDIKPFTHFDVTMKALLFKSKTPGAVRRDCANKSFRRYLRSNLPWAAGAILLDPLDGVDVENNLQRLEFMRRYMEKGAAAVQPTPGTTPYKPIHNPIKRARADGLSFYRIFMECVYWFGAGPLMDAWIDFWRSRADWPEEVYRLCAPDADLSGFDTTPVHPAPDVFYRYDLKRGGYYLCDRDGERIG